MVFPSLPAYLDPTNPANWQQQRPAATNSAVPTQPQSQPQPPTHGSIRPGSMSERARMANIALPETGLKCPRCDSTNTKFCYFNNYNLSQPRHFCKACRRYWTRGGALRNVPVGGGCRRNKRTKSNNTKSSSTTSSSINVNTTSSSDAGTTSSLGSIISSFKTGLLPAASAGHDHMLSLRSSLPSSSLRLLNDFPNAGEISLEGLNYGAVSAPISHWFPGTASSQLPLLGSLDVSSSPFQHSSMDHSLYAGLGSGRIRAGMFPTPGNNSNNQDLNIHQFLGNEQQQLWGVGNNCSNSWTDVSNFTSSSSPNNNAL